MENVIVGGRHDVNDLKEINEKLRNTINNNSYKWFKYVKIHLKADFGC